MITLFRRILAKRDLKRLNNGVISYGDKMWVYFKNVKRCYKMTLSGMSHEIFIARFESVQDMSDSKVIDDYGQFLDNDIRFYKSSGEPVKFNFI